MPEVLADLSATLWDDRSGGGCPIRTSYTASRVPNARILYAVHGFSEEVTADVVPEESWRDRALRAGKEIAPG